MLDKLTKLLKLPETATVVCIMSVGYPAESREAGGQTLRYPFEELFFEMEYGQSFKEDPQVVENLKQDKLIQAPAPLPWRDEELKYVVRGLGIEERRQAMGFEQSPSS